MAQADETRSLDIREQLARIDQMLTNRVRARQEIHLIARWKIFIPAMIVGAALFAAGMVLAKLFWVKCHG
jgi:hypothetical protein